MTECYNGISVIPQQIEEPCGGVYTSTDCIQSPNANVTLDLPSGATQTQTNAALTTALVYKEQQIQSILSDITQLDGSETKIEAGDNVTITGIGTNLNPFVVNALGGGGNQDLQSVVDTGGILSYNLGSSYCEFFTGVSDNKILEFQTDNGLGFGTPGHEGSLNYMHNDFVELQNYSYTSRGDIQIGNGQIQMYQQNLGSPGRTYFNFTTPTVNTTIRIPAKTIAGTYIFSTIPTTIYTVATLPIGVLNDIATVSDALAPTYLGTLTGGGSVTAPVWHNGTTWVSR